MRKRYLSVIVGLLLCGAISERPPARISYTINVTSTLADKEVNVEVQNLNLEGNSEPVTTKRTTPFEITAEAGVFKGVFTRLSGAAEMQVDVYCEGCKEERILYGHGTQVSMKLDGEERTFSVRK